VVVRKLETSNRLEPLAIQEHVNPRFNLERELKGSGFVDTGKTQIRAPNC
jgi:hypothetical protein